MAQQLSLKTPNKLQYKREQKIDRVLLLGTSPLEERMEASLVAQGFSVERLPIEVPFRELKDLKQVLKTFRKKYPLDDLWVHPGLTDWSHRAELPQLGKTLNMNVIAPSIRGLSTFANQLTFLSLADEIKVPNLLISSSPIQTLRELQKFIQPMELDKFVLKSVYGRGNGIGTRVFQNGETLEREFYLWKQELQILFEDPLFFLERFLDDARRIVVPYVRFSSGEVIFLPWVESSLEDGFKELIEFCPPIGLEDIVVQNIKKHTKTLLESIQFVGVGELEFLSDGERVYLTGGSTTLKEHFCLWEEVSHTSLVDWQLQTMTQKDSGLSEEKRESFFRAPEDFSTETSRRAILLHLYAEDSVTHCPRPGWIEELSPERTWEGVHFDSRIYTDLKAHTYRAMDQESRVACWLAVGKNDDFLISSLHAHVKKWWVAGEIETNLKILEELLSHPRVKNGMIFCGFVDEEFFPLPELTLERANLLCQVCEEISAKTPRDQTQWVIDTKKIPDVKPVSLTWVEKHDFISLGRRGLRGMLKVGAKADPARVLVFPLGHDRFRFFMDRSVFTVKKGSKNQPLDRLEYRSLVKGRVHSILFQEKARVTAGEPLILIESMQRLIPHRSRVPLQIASWRVEAGDFVDEGDELGEVLTGVLFPSKGNS